MSEKWTRAILHDKVGTLGIEELDSCSTYRPAPVRPLQGGRTGDEESAEHEREKKHLALADPTTQVKSLDGLTPTGRWAIPSSPTPLRLRPHTAPTKRSRAPPAISSRCAGEPLSCLQNGHIVVGSFLDAPERLFTASSVWSGSRSEPWIGGFARQRRVGEGSWTQCMQTLSLVVHVIAFIVTNGCER